HGERGIRDRPRRGRRNACRNGVDARLGMTEIRTDTTPPIAPDTAREPKGNRMNKRLRTGIALSAVTLLGLSACAADPDSGNTGDTGDTGDKTELTIGVFNGWPEGEAASYLWQIILEEEGYDVTLEYADAGTVFLGVSEGDYDVAL